MAFVCGAWQLLTCYQPVLLDMYILVFVRETNSLYFKLTLIICYRLLQV